MLTVLLEYIIYLMVWIFVFGLFVTVLLECIKLLIHMRLFTDFRKHGFYLIFNKHIYLETLIILTWDVVSQDWMFQLPYWNLP